MSSNIINTVILAGSFLALFASAELLYHKLNVRAEFTRKLVHLGTGILTLLFPILLNNHWPVLFLCASFALILFLSLKFNLLKSINAIDRKSHGSISYPISVYFCYLAYDYCSSRYSNFNGNYIYFYLPILTLAICDPVAALTGKRWPLGKYKIGKDHKSMMGSSMFFLSAFVLSFILMYMLNSKDHLLLTLTSSAILALISCLAEALSPNGLDNLSIPLVSVITLYIIMNTLFAFKFL
jgi:phytol kinase